MKIKWLGHSCFQITSEKGTRIITDPFTSDRNTTYKEVTLEADIVTSSHDHFDHNHTGPIKGNPEIIREAVDKTVRDVRVRAVRTWHDEIGGRERGPNLVFCLTVDGVTVCHMGDIGEQLQKSHIEAIGKVDVILVPIGGVFTLDYGPAMQLCENLKPSIIIPMHYKTEQCQWLKWTADDFIRGRKNYRKLDAGEIEIIAGKLPVETEIIIPKYTG